MIEQLNKLGGANGPVKFKPLYDATMDIFEALSGTLVAAKKRGVVDYDGQLLMSGIHNDVAIKLLKQTIEDSPIPDKEQFLSEQTKGPIKAGGFDKVDPTNVSKNGVHVFIMWLVKIYSLPFVSSLQTPSYSHPCLVHTPSPGSSLE